MSTVDLLLMGLMVLMSIISVGSMVFVTHTLAAQMLAAQSSMFKYLEDTQQIGGQPVSIAKQRADEVTKLREEHIRRIPNPKDVVGA